MSKDKKKRKSADNKFLGGSDEADEFEIIPAEEVSEWDLMTKDEQQALLDQDAENEAAYLQELEQWNKDADERLQQEETAMKANSFTQWVSKRNS